MGFSSRTLIAIWTVFLALDYGRPLKAEAPSQVRLILIGDSTVKNGSGKGDGGLWGWGQVIADHFDSQRMVIENRALGGRSSRTYFTEGLWEKSLQRVRPGDFVLMQFGHNDGGDKFKGDRPRASIKGNGDETVDGIVEATGEKETVHSYGWYLRKYISDTRAKGATPIVLSLVPRDRWEEGRVIRSNRDYGKWAAEAAKQEKAIFIDLNEIVALRYEELGEEKVGRDLFTEKDWTHTTHEGAEVNAACLAKAIRALKDCPLKELLLPPQVPAKAGESSWKFDFGNGMVATDFRQVLPNTTYSKEIGFGWEPGANIQCIEQKSSNAATHDACKSDSPYYFSVAVPEGNYRVRVQGGVGPLTVKAELRRLMIENHHSRSANPNEFEFTVNVRTPKMPKGNSVRLKPRETESEAWAWDERLTLEFNGLRPCVSTITIDPEPDAITVFLAGDSTVADQPVEPWNSWGQMLPRFFKPGVAIANHSESGESIRSSLDARRFEKIFSLIHPGDYLFIQFGHNDMKDKSPDALSKYKSNLSDLVTRAREVDATPVLITPMERKPGPNYISLGEYPQLVRNVARELKVSLIDLNAMSRRLYPHLGDQIECAFQDGTHHTSYGSYLLAQCVMQGICDLELGLTNWIVDDFAGFEPENPTPFNLFNVPPSPVQNATIPAGS